MLDAMLSIACPLLLVAAAAVNPLDQSDAQPVGSAGAGMNGEVAVKLLLAGGISGVTALALVFRPGTRVRLRRMPGIVLVALSLVFLTTSVFAFSGAANVSRAAAVICLVYVGFLAVTTSYLSRDTAAKCLLAGLSLHMLAAWTLHWIGGDATHFQEDFGNGLTVARMGSTAHPNSLGRIGALALIIAFALWRTLAPAGTRARSTIWLIPVAVLAIATIVESMSRTAMASGVIAILAMSLDRLLNWRGLVVALTLLIVAGGITIGAGLLPGGVSLGESVVAAGTKTGDVSELTSATGRTAIWAESVRLISQRPLTGWGLNSAPLLLEDFSHHTHNLLLHTMFSGGVVAGAFTVVLLMWTAWRAVSVLDPLFRGVAAYVFVSGIFEDTVFETFPFTSTLLWLLVLMSSSAGESENESLVQAAQEQSIAPEKTAPKRDREPTTAAAWT